MLFFDPLRRTVTFTALHCEARVYRVVQKKSQSVIYNFQHAIFVHLHRNMNNLDDDDWKVPVGHRRLRLCLHIDDVELACRYANI